MQFHVSTSLNIPPYEAEILMSRNQPLTDNAMPKNSGFPALLMADSGSREFRPYKEGRRLSIVTDKTALCLLLGRFPTAPASHTI